MIFDNGDVVELDLDPLYVGPAGRQGRTLAFPAPAKMRPGKIYRTGKINGEPARLLIDVPIDAEGRLSPVALATPL